MSAAFAIDCNLSFSSLVKGVNILRPTRTLSADRGAMSGLRTEVGNLIRHHRERAGLTQSDLAGAIERSVQLIGRMERGKAAPSFETLEALSRALGTPVRDFFGAGPYAAGGLSNDPLARIVGRLADLDAADLDWMDRLVGHALSRKPARRTAPDGDGGKSDAQ